MKRTSLSIVVLISLLFAKRAELVIPADSVSTEHLERSITLGNVADTFRVSFDETLWDFTQRRNSAQNIYEGIEVGKDSLASTAILYGLKLYAVTDSTLVLSGKRQIKREDRYYERVGTSNSIQVYKNSLKRVSLGKTKRQRLVFPIIAITVFGALAAVSSYNKK